MSLEDLTKKAALLRDEGRLGEAELLLRSGLSENPRSANVWWGLFLVYDEKKDHAKGREALEKTVELAPDFAPANRNLGRILKNEDVDAAIILFERAATSDDELGALRELISIYYERKQHTDVIRIGQLYEPRARLTSEHSVLLGNSYLSEGQLENAEREYLLLVREGHTTPARFNLGLVYNHAQSGRYLDALDTWRMALLQNPEYDRPIKSISGTIAATIELFDRPINKAPTWAPTPYEVYLNPLSLLELPADCADSDLNPKALQKNKARLLREIELEDGRVDWLPGLCLDRSRAVGLLEQLNDSRQCSYHKFVHSAPDLESFLQQGSLALFKPEAEQWPLETIRRLESDPDGFGRWLSGFYARQMGQMQIKAIENKDLQALRLLNSGRLWIKPTDWGLCFDPLRRFVDRELKPLREVRERIDDHPTTARKLEQVLNSVRDTLLIARGLHDELSEVVRLLRGISIASYNVRDDVEEALKILMLSEPFAARSKSLKVQYDQDLLALLDLDKKQKENEVSLTFKKQAFNITRNKVEYGSTVFAAKDVTAVRVGTLITNGQGGKTYNNMVYIGTENNSIDLSWTGTTDKDSELANKVLFACMSYLLPHVVSHIRTSIRAGQTVRIGDLHINKDGVSFESGGWLFKSWVRIPWSRYRTSLENGSMIVIDEATPKNRASLDLRAHSNVLALSHLP